ncbi:MAG: MFS transporter [Betaproteobacteria bacterium]|nr:MFS transporter [Betaproteobacteria bacterium]
MNFRYVYAAFAAAYLLSYLFRTANAVISPELSRELALNPSALGLLTSAYFLAFAAMQLPVGMLLDRYGPRRVEPVLLGIASLGSFLFAYAETILGLTMARALIGLGVCACLMAPLKAIATWYPPEKQASLSGWIMVAGASGVLAATAPLEFALRFTSWRIVFIALGFCTLAAAVAIWWRVPDIPKPQGSVGLAAQWSGVRSVFRHPRFWWIAPLAAVGMGSFMAVQGLWAVPWLLEVEGETRPGAAQHLLAMSIVIIALYVALGIMGTRLARRGVHARHLFACGFTVNTLALSAIILRVPGSYVWWSLYGLGASVNVLAFAVLTEGFGRELAGRTNTALNLLMFASSFLAQWGIGVIVDATRVAFALDEAGGLRAAFALILVLLIASNAWFVWGWRQHAARHES